MIIKRLIAALAVIGGLELARNDPGRTVFSEMTRGPRILETTKSGLDGRRGVPTWNSKW